MIFSIKSKENSNKINNKIFKEISIIHKLSIKCKYPLVQKSNSKNFQIKHRLVINLHKISKKDENLKKLNPQEKLKWL